MSTAEVASAKLAHRATIGTLMENSSDWKKMELTFK